MHLQMSCQTAWRCKVALAPFHFAFVLSLWLMNHHVWSEGTLVLEFLITIFALVYKMFISMLSEWMWMLLALESEPFITVIAFEIFLVCMDFAHMLFKAPLPSKYHWALRTLNRLFLFSKRLLFISLFHLFHFLYSFCHLYIFSLKMVF